MLSICGNHRFRLNRPSRAALGTLLLTLFCSGATRASALDVSLTGVVRNRAGVPLPDVMISLNQGGHSGQALTDAFGRFTLDAELTEPITLVFSKTGYDDRMLELASSAAGQDFEVIMLATGEAIISDRIMVVGDASSADRIPGSAHYVSDIQESNVPFGDVHQMLRQVPGVNVQEEDGFGLRPNIGMRGTASERSAKITLMEDGILVAPAPYAAPAAYYFPTVARMQAMEIRKGSSQVKFGPNTNGGVLNLVSKDIPDRFRLRGSLAGGAHSTGRLNVAAGDSGERLGWLLETFQLRSDGFKRLDSGGSTGFRIGDYLGKFRVNSDVNADVYQQLEIKVGKTTQRSDETYLGLTDPDFALDARRRYRGSQVDRFDSDHEQYQLTYLIAPSESFDVTTSLYRNNFQRNWYKLQSVLGTGISDIFDDTEAGAAELEIIKGADSTADALNVRANNRDYYAQGVQSIAGFRLGTAHRLEAGFRYHKDQEDRFQHEDGYRMLNGFMELTSRGAAGGQSNRVGDASALAFFGSDTIEMGRWTLTPGVRFEHIELTRTDYAKGDPQRTEPTRVRENTLDVVVPGVGFRYDPDASLSFFGGLHRGFSPPGPGSSEETKPEFSVNYEGGARWSSGTVELQGTAFVNNYSNLLGADTLSSGGTGEGDLFNGGRARSWGLELSGRGDLASGRLGGFQIPLRVAYTFSRATFLESFSSDFDPWGEVEAGDQLPYISPHQLFAEVRFEARSWRLGMESVWIDRMRTSASQGTIQPLQATDSQLTFNLAAEWDIAREGQSATVYIAVQNLTDARYIVARRPAGIRPGLIRTLMAGIRFSLGR